MFDRFNDPARRALVGAQRAAGTLGSPFVGTEHLLLGILGEKSQPAARVLEAHGVDEVAVTTQIDEMIVDREEGSHLHVPFSPRAKAVLELSLREALRMGSSYIGTEHLLLGVLGHGEGVAGQILISLTVDTAMLRRHLAVELGGDSGQRSPGERSVDLMVRVGGLEISAETALELVHKYIDGEVAPWAHRSYDVYTTNNDSNRLADGDFLAPGLLGVPVDSPTFVHLRECRLNLEQFLAEIPDDVSLVDATEETLDAIGRPFGVIDDGLVSGARGVILSKILHRKKPALVPIFDQFVWVVYRTRTGEEAKRSWPAFITTLATEMRSDLQGATGLWDRWEPATSALRALDMAVWQLGQNHDGAPPQG